MFLIQTMPVDSSSPPVGTSSASEPAPSSVPECGDGCRDELLIPGKEGPTTAIYL